MSKMRITGTVIDLTEKSGSGQFGPWKMTIANVDVPGLDYVDVTVPDDIHLRIGDALDHAVDVSAANGGRLRIALLKPWVTDIRTPEPGKLPVDKPAAAKMPNI